VDRSDDVVEKQMPLIQGVVSSGEPDHGRSLAYGAVPSRNLGRHAINKESFQL